MAPKKDATETDAPPEESDDDGTPEQEAAALARGMLRRGINGITPQTREDFHALMAKHGVAGETDEIFLRSVCLFIMDNADDFRTFHRAKYGLED